MPETPAGATPVAGGTTPPQTPDSPAPVTPAHVTPPVDEDAALGEAGLKALKAERKRADDAEKAAKAAADELAQIKEASKTEAEKAIEAARKEGASAERVRSDAKIRAAEVRLALVAAGVPSEMIGLVSKDDAFANLKVNDEGEVSGLADAVKSAKEAYPQVFAAPAAAPAGRPDYGAGARGKPANSGTDMNDLIRRAAGRRA